MFAPILLLAGCATPNQKAADTSLREAHIDPSTAASVTGKVLFSGTAPKPVKLDLSANPTCQRQHSKPVYSESVVLNKNGTLRNTLVWVKSGLPQVHWTAPAIPVALDQVGCVYQPHVVALMVGQTLEVANSDPLNHNVHAESSANEPFNVLEPPRAEKINRTFARPEQMIPITCGVHQWMRAYVSVVEHPFFAVTGENGTFELKGLPPGKYVIEAVHERFGRTEKLLSLTAHESAAVDFTYR